MFHKHMSSYGKEIGFMIFADTELVKPDFLKFPPHISDIQQVLSNQVMKCTVTSCQTEQFFIRKSNRSNSFPGLCKAPENFFNSGLAACNLAKCFGREIESYVDICMKGDN